jgi:hypothetical protein
MVYTTFMHLSFANVNAAAPFALPIPHSTIGYWYWQLATLPHWQHYLHPLHFLHGQNMIRTHSVNSVHSRFFVPSRWLPSCFRSNAYIKQNRRILKLEGYGDSAD